MRADVNALMAGELGQWLADQSAMRDAAREKARWRWTWGAALAMIPLALVWFGPSGLGAFRAIVTMAAVAGVGVWGYLPIAQATKAIKVGINSGIAKSLGISYAHDVEAGAEFEAAKTYGLVPGYDRKKLEDRWFGRLENHRFSLYETHLERRRGSGKNRRWVTVFRGALIDMEFGRDFRSTTLLQRAGKHRKWLGLGGAKDEVSFAGHHLARVDQVHPAFEDVFDLYSDDPVEARVLAHPSYVEHLLALERAFKGDAVRALFHRGEVVIAVESGKLFESGSIIEEDDRRKVEEAAEQFGSLAKLALAINQNERGRAIGSAGPDNARALDAATGVHRSAFGRKR
ncbi:MAG: DUF3137 domain-containing protein [Erythrobacter sp.]|uniref:DUF3137 domain-containing protein n=1 Tax=Erythrobacter sp. TaxID=1042 RepID=UPI00261E2E3D|nr:DUF3137 domain-containing protein [Erythrobacter sp.]MDJ0977328.1 DUF3137 domain-containing protein [Erythrobacter sp.]